MKTSLIIEKVSNKTNIKYDKVKLIIQTLISVIINELLKGNNIVLNTLGKFSIKNKKARKGYDPVNMKYINIQSMNYIKFNPSNKLKNNIKKT